MRTVCLLLILMVGPVSNVGHAQPAPSKPGPPARLSRSKLSIHLISRYTPGARRVVAAGPRVLKVLDLGGDMRQALRDYKRKYPQGKTILRLYTQVRYTLADSPERSAQDFWSRALWPPLSGLPAVEQRQIDYLEGPNEGDSTPSWQSVESARWFGRFWATLAPLMHDHGFRPCVGSIAVGNPPGTPDEMEARLEAFLPALESAKRMGGAWSYHAYTIRYTTDVGEESWYSLRYRRFYHYLRRRHPGLVSLPLILTEGGVDQSGSPQSSGYRARGTPTHYEQWLAWFDSELCRDAYVLGVTLFESGDASGWPSFDIEPVAPWLAKHLGRMPGIKERLDDH